MDPKSILKSKTLWFNLLVAVLEVLRQSGLVEALPQDWIAGAAVLGNVGLRFVTNQPVTLGIK